MSSVVSPAHTYHFLVMQLHHGEEDVGLKQVAPSTGILIHAALGTGVMQEGIWLVNVCMLYTDFGARKNRTGYYILHKFETEKCLKGMPGSVGGNYETALHSPSSPPHLVNVPP